MEKGSIYHQILGVGPDASLEEIKRAYKRKAKELHPDYNPSPSAHEEFIKLNEAYVQLTSPQKENNNWDNPVSSERRAYAKEQARAYAKKRYEEFVNSQYYKEMMKLNEYGDILFYLMTILIVNAISICITDFVEKDDNIIDLPNAWMIPALLSGAIAMISFPHTRFNYISNYENNLHNYEWGLLGICFSIHFYAFLFVCTNTLIPMSTLWLGILGGCASVLLYNLLRNRKSIRIFTHPILLGLLPISLTLIINNESDFKYEMRFFSQESFEMQFQSNPMTKRKIEESAADFRAVPYNGTPIRFKEGLLGYPIFVEVLKRR